VIQCDLYGNPVQIVIGKKDGPRQRQYLFPPDIITIIDAIHLNTGKSKPEIVSEAVRLAAKKEKDLSEEDRKKISSKK